MPRYDVTFTRGEYTREKSRHLIEAKDSDEAMSKAYRMREAKCYDSVWVSEHIEGLTNYICEIELQMFWNGKRESSKWSEYQRFDAISEEDAKRQARAKFLGKYFAGAQYHKGTELLNKPLEKGQSMLFSQIIDCYQS